MLSEELQSSHHLPKENPCCDLYPKFSSLLPSAVLPGDGQLAVLV